MSYWNQALTLKIWMRSLKCVWTCTSKCRWSLYKGWKSMPKLSPQNSQTYGFSHGWQPNIHTAKRLKHDQMAWLTLITAQTHHSHTSQTSPVELIALIDSLSGQSWHQPPSALRATESTCSFRTTRSKSWEAWPRRSSWCWHLHRASAASQWLPRWPTQQHCVNRTCRSCPGCWRYPTPYLLSGRTGPGQCPRTERRCSSGVASVPICHGYLALPLPLVRLCTAVQWSVTQSTKNR